MFGLQQQQKINVKRIPEIGSETKSYTIFITIFQSNTKQNTRKDGKEKQANNNKNNANAHHPRSYAF